MRFTMILGCLALALTPCGDGFADLLPVSVKLVTESVLNPVFVGDTLPLKIVIENHTDKPLKLLDMRTLGPHADKNGTNHFQPYYDLWLTKPDGKLVLVRSHAATEEGEWQVANPVTIPAKSKYSFYQTVLFSTPGFALDKPGEYHLAVAIGTNLGDFRSGQFALKVKERDGMTSEELMLLVVKTRYWHELEFRDRLSHIPKLTAPLKRRLAGGNLLRDLELHDQCAEACMRIELWTHGLAELDVCVREQIKRVNRLEDEVRNELSLINLARSCARKNRWGLAGEILAKLPQEEIHSLVQFRKQVAQAAAGKPIASVNLVTKSVLKPLLVGDAFPVKIVVENLGSTPLRIKDMRPNSGSNNRQPFFDFSMIKPSGKLSGVVSDMSAGRSREFDDIVIPPAMSYSFYEIIFLDFLSLAIDEPGEYRLTASVTTDQGDFSSDAFVFTAKERDGLAGTELLELFNKIPETYRYEFRFFSSLSYVPEYTVDFKRCVTNGNLHQHIQFHDQAGLICQEIDTWGKGINELDKYVRGEVAKIEKSTDEVRKEMALMEIARAVGRKKQWKLSADILAKLPQEPIHSIVNLRKIVGKEVGSPEGSR